MTYVFHGYMFLKEYALKVLDCFFPVFFLFFSLIFAFEFTPFLCSSVFLVSLVFSKSLLGFVELASIVDASSHDCKSL